MNDAADLRPYVERLRTLVRRMSSDLSVVEAIVIKLERMASNGTHKDLPGNGQSTDDLHL